MLRPSDEELAEASKDALSGASSSTASALCSASVDWREGVRSSSISWSSGVCVGSMLRHSLLKITPAQQRACLFARILIDIIRCQRPAGRSQQAAPEHLGAVACFDVRSRSCPHLATTWQILKSFCQSNTHRLGNARRNCHTTPFCQQHSLRRRNCRGNHWQSGSHGFKNRHRIDVTGGRKEEQVADTQKQRNIIPTL